MNRCDGGLIVEVGNRGLSLEEQRTHFNLWALSKSPLLIGTHVTPFSCKDLLTT